MVVERRGSLGRVRRVGDLRSQASGVRRVGAPRVSEIQRLRLLAAAVGAVEELGYPGASVASITERARVSRRTFYDLFDNREECVVAVLESAVAQVAFEFGAAKLGGLPWLERIRGGLWVLLCFFDREPALARVCVVHSQRAGQGVLERRQGVFDRLAVIVDEGRGESSRAGGLGSLTAQGVVGAVWTILQARLLEAEGGALRDLLGELMAMIVLPYRGASIARREQARPVPASMSVFTASGERVGARFGSVEPLARIPMRLTYRTALVLEELADHPGSSNRQISDRAGVHDQGQMSKLLARLERFGLIVNGADGGPAKGEPNEWALTPIGLQVTRSINAHVADIGHGWAS